MRPTTLRGEIILNSRCQGLHRDPFSDVLRANPRAKQTSEMLIRCCGTSEGWPRVVRFTGNRRAATLLVALLRCELSRRAATLNSDIL